MDSEGAGDCPPTAALPPGSRDQKQAATSEQRGTSSSTHWHDADDDADAPELSRFGHLSLAAYVVANAKASLPSRFTVSE